jgi:hypothetical protein
VGSGNWPACLAYTPLVKIPVLTAGTAWYQKNCCQNGLNHKRNEPPMPRSFHGVLYFPARIYGNNGLVLQFRSLNNLFLSVQGYETREYFLKNKDKLCKQPPYTGIFRLFLTINVIPYQMKKLFIAILAFTSFSSLLHAQYYYKDIIGTQETNKLISTYKSQRATFQRIQHYTGIQATAKDAGHQNL